MQMEEREWLFYLLSCCLIASIYFNMMIMWWGWTGEVNKSLDITLEVEEEEEEVGTGIYCPETERRDSD